MPSSCAMRLLGCPWATNCNTSRCRAVGVGAALAGAGAGISNTTPPSAMCCSAAASAGTGCDLPRKPLAPAPRAAAARAGSSSPEISTRATSGNCAAKSRRPSRPVWAPRRWSSSTRSRSCSAPATCSPASSVGAVSTCAVGSAWASACAKPTQNRGWSSTSKSFMQGIVVYAGGAPGPVACLTRHQGLVHACCRIASHLLRIRAAPRVVGPALCAGFVCPPHCQKPSRVTPEGAAVQEGRWICGQAAAFRHLSSIKP